MTSALALAILLAQPSIPVSARVVEGTPPAVELTNTGSRPITAWSFAVTSPNAQGGTHHETHTADVYLSAVTRDLPRSPEHLDWLQPGRRVRVPIDAAPPNASVELVAVIFADRTAIGDPQIIHAFFEHRGVERDQLRDVSNVMESVLKTQRGVDALNAIDAQLVHNNPESVPHRTARDAVAAYLAAPVGTSGRDDALDQQIRQYAAFVKKQYELAAEHAEPRR